MQSTSTQLPLRTPRRTAPVAIAGVLQGLAAALMFRAGLGLDPWNVLVAGLADVLAIPFAVAFAVVGSVVVAAVRGLRSGDVVDAATVALAATASVAVAVALIPEPAARDIELGCTMLVAGVLLGGVGLSLMRGVTGSSAASEQLWETIVDRTGLTPFQAQALVQGTVGTIGFALGGLVNFGTALAVLTTGAIVRAATPSIVRAAGPHVVPGADAASIDEPVATGQPTPQSIVASTSLTAPARVSGLMNASRSTVRPRHLVGTQSSEQSSATRRDQAA